MLETWATSSTRPDPTELSLPLSVGRASASLTSWGDLGGYSANKAVLEDPAFLEQTPYNAAFAETMTMVKDFYNIPIFNELLFAYRDPVAKYVIGGEGTAQEALDAAAEAQAELLRDAGFLE